MINKNKIKGRMVMATAKAGFIVFGVHKDGLKDPMGTPFIDEKIIKNLKKALEESGIELVIYETVIAIKNEAREALKKMKDDESIDCIILFSGTWVQSRKQNGKMYRAIWQSITFNGCCFILLFPVFISPISVFLRPYTLLLPRMNLMCHGQMSHIQPLTFCSCSHFSHHKYFQHIP